MLGLALGTRALAARAWTAFTAYRTPFAFTNPEASSGPALADRVVIVLVDGLTLSASRAMPFLNELRRRGGDADCRVGLPSLSLPGRAVLMTGAWQEVNGQTTNFNPRPLTVGHLFQAARKKGLRTAYAAGARARRLFEPFVDEDVPYRPLPDSHDFGDYASRLHRTLEADRRLLTEKQPQLYFIDVSLMDQVGHGWGAASAEYARGARMVDDELLRLAADLDLSRSVLIVTADHGHVARGGHGGSEPDVMTVPLVLAGASIRPGARATAEQVDVAPTVAALLGTEIPASNQGRVLLELLDVSPAARQAIEARLAAQRRSFAGQYLAWLEGGAAGLAPGLEDPERAVADARYARLQREARARGLQAAAMVTAMALALVALVGLRVATAGEIGAAFACAAAGAALYFALLRPFGLGYSFTAINKDDRLAAFFAKDMALGVGTCALAAAALAAGYRRRGAAATRLEQARLAWLAAAAFVSLFLLKMAIVYWRSGVILGWSMPELRWAFGFYLDALVVMAVGLASPLLPLPVWLAARAGPHWQDLPTGTV
ncbi:MAG TPA: alkaline phosphatase family protein [Vicinamibacteria bacterium]